MLYLAEVKSQNRGFVGGFKTELKLLASQAADQTWNTVAGEEIIATDTIGDQTGKGTLYIINLDNNKQLQGTPELAGSRVVNYLRHFSRTLEKSKSQEEEIEEWKTSLKIQGEEIGRRQSELDQQQQVVQQQQQEFSRLEEEKTRLNGAWEQLRAEQQKIGENQANQGQIENKLQNILAEARDSNFSSENLQQVFHDVNTQQNVLDNYWQQLESKRVTLERKQEELEDKIQSLEKRRQEIESSRNSLQKAIIALEINETLLKEKEESLKQLNQYLETFNRLDQEISYLGNDNDHQEIDFNALESMPLGELEELVNEIQQKTSEQFNSVNPQEEELTEKSNRVKEIQQKIHEASEVERFSLETELADAQEEKKFANESLVGQRITLKKQQKMLNQYLKIFSRRKGIIDLEFADSINVRPVLDEIESQRNFTEKHRDKLNTEINDLINSKTQIEQNIANQQQIYSQHQAEYKQEDAYYVQLYENFTQNQTEVTLLEESLHPIQEQLNNIRNHLQTLQQSTQKLTHVFHQLQSIS